MSDRGIISGPMMDQIGASQDWQEYAVADFGSGDVDLKHPTLGTLPKAVVVVTDGNLLCRNARGVDRFLTSVIAPYVHLGQVASIAAGNPTKVVVYW